MFCIVKHSRYRLNLEYNNYFACLTVFNKCPECLGFPECTAFRPASPLLVPRLSAVRLGKQTGEERKRAAAGILLALASLGEILYCLYQFL